MRTEFQSIAIIGKYKNSAITGHVRHLADFLYRLGISVWLDNDTAMHCGLTDWPHIPMAELGNHARLAVVIGGDGTMLSAARTLFQADIPLVGINSGRIGFLTDITSDLMLNAIERILQGEYSLERRMLLDAVIMRNGSMVGHGFAMNDVVIANTAKCRLIELEVNIDGQFVHRQRADGLIVASPTGTTAYALSAGGPILHPTLEALALVPICPHTLSNRPIAINAASLVEITLLDGIVAAHFDAQTQQNLELGDKIIIKRADKRVSLLHPLGHSHYDMLRQKLNWG